MIAVIQRVYDATVYADGDIHGFIDKGLYILLGVKNTDTKKDAEILAEKVSKLRIFSDENDKMNLSVIDVGGEVLVVSNFTLYADYSHGNRPSYFTSAQPSLAEPLYEYFVKLIEEKVGSCEKGKFGAHMETKMRTDGPVTILMDSEVLLANKK